MVTPEAAFAGHDDGGVANQNERVFPSVAQRHEAALAEFWKHAVEGVETPAHPELVNRLRELYGTAYSAISPEGDTPEVEGRRQVSALKDAVLLLDKDMESTHPGLPPVTNLEAQKMLAEYFGVEIPL